MISEVIKSLQHVGQAFKFEFEPLLVIWQSLRRLIQKVIKGLEGKFKGQALGSAFQHYSGGSDRQAQHRAFPSLLQSLLAVTGSLEENIP